VGVVKLLTKRYQFCEESVKIGKECPVKAGVQILQHSVDLPKEIPPGKYTVNVRVKNPASADGGEGQEVTCLIAKAQFGI
ncbi:Phosphatidylglycerol/phosphatidylinositol transfer protein, partial [Dissophora ornata]